jgi:hypothetical protein
MANLQWTLLPWQLKVWQSKKRFKVLACGRRVGKSNFAIKKTLAEGVAAPKGSAVVYVAPTQSQARQICWDALLDEGKDVIKSAHVNSMDITLVNGVKIHVRSAENPDTLRGLKLYFAVIDEAAFIKDDTIWTKIIRPALSDLEGEAILISSPSGRNWFYDLFKYAESGDDEDWEAYHFTTYDNPTIKPKEIEAAKKSLSSFVFRQEFEASFATAGSGLFKEEWIKFSEEPAQGSYYIAIDLAGFEDVSKNASASKKRLDQTAIAIVKVTDDGNWWVKKIEAGRWDIQATALKILQAIREYQPIAVGIERGALKNAVLPYLSDLMRKNNCYAHIQDLTHGNKKKVDRVIWSLQGRIEHGRLSLNCDENFDELVDEMLMFPSAGVHDDLIDALSYIDQLAVTSYFDGDDDQDDWEVLDVISGY